MRTLYLNFPQMFHSGFTFTNFNLFDIVCLAHLKHRKEGLSPLYKGANEIRGSKEIVSGVSVLVRGFKSHITDLSLYPAPHKKD